MALSQGSTCTQVSTLVHAELAHPQSPRSQPPPTATRLKSDMACFQGASALRSTGPQTRSMAAPRAPKASSVALKELAVKEAAEEDSVAQLVSQVSEDFEDAVESVIEDPASAMRVRRSSGKSAMRTSRRRALVMCLALGMVRPCASDIVAGRLRTGSIRRTTSSGLTRSASTSFTVSGNLSSQVSIASSLKAANLLEDKEDDTVKL